MLNIEMSEAEAIEKARTGDVSGYEGLYHLHKQRVYAWCLRFTGNVSDAEDLTQEVFLQVFRKLSTFRGNAKFGSWLYRIAINLSGMQFRRRPQEVSLSSFGEVKEDQLGPDLSSRSCICSFALERMVLRQAIGSLSKARRSVVLLHDVKGFTHAEVAQHLGLAVGTSKSQLSRAHLTLRNILGGATRGAAEGPELLS